MKKLRVGQIGTLHDHSQGKLACAAKFPDIFEIVKVGNIRIFTSSQFTLLAITTITKSAK